ncbi:hypothetical protein [Agarilytica rhodophyticola]|uniref:hypothetical protein n=1 Tax=Agarilytica rhodophyticola TaxID=1737490 RepID=UPI000B3451AF|nr:hypothetical protein [Agarilytica rhodophyticola]
MKTMLPATRFTGPGAISKGFEKSPIDTNTANLVSAKTSKPKILSKPITKSLLQPLGENGRRKNAARTAVALGIKYGGKQAAIAAAAPYGPGAALVANIAMSKLQAKAEKDLKQAAQNGEKGAGIAAAITNNPIGGKGAKLIIDRLSK